MAETETRPEKQHHAVDKIAHKRVMEHRRTIVADLMAQRLSHAEITRRLKDLDPPIEVHPGTVSSDIAAIRQQWRQHCIEAYDAHVADTRRQLNVLEQECMPIVMESIDDDVKLRAIYAELAITDRIMRLLGLEPTTTTRSITARMTPDGHGGNQLEVEASLTEHERDTRANRIVGILTDAGYVDAGNGAGFSDEPPAEFLDIIEAAGGPAGELGAHTDAEVDELHSPPAD